MIIVRVGKNEQKVKKSPGKNIFYRKLYDNNHILQV